MAHMLASASMSGMAAAAAPVEFLGTSTQGGLGGEALYCAVILWLSLVSWILFTCVDDDGGAGGSRRRRGGRRGGSRGSPVFVGASGLCDGTGPGCSGGFGPCGSCID